MGLLRISPLLGNDMVLQQGVSVPVSGKAAPGAEVSVSFMGETRRAQADGEGNWRLLLESRPSGGPYEMEILSESEKISIKNIYFGDVWICSGQSNMELPMQRVRDDFPEEWQPPVNSLIRQFKVPQEWDFSGPRDSLSGGCWAPASAETLHDFSAAAWFFARAVFEKHGAPIGLINASWGGTPAEAWMSREALAAFPEKIACGEQYADAALREKITRDSEKVIKAWNDELAAGDSGLRRLWHKPEQWDRPEGRIPLPGDFAGTGIGKLCGSIWLHREFYVEGGFAAGGGAKLWLGTIVDADTVYVNGAEVGNTTYRYPPRKYPLPAGLLREGKNHIVIRVICNNGEGGVTSDKDFRIFSGCGSIELAGDWEYRVGISLSSPSPEAFFFQRQPMGLFNAMIAPVLGFPCSGILWYQGESNDGNPHEYSQLFSSLIKDWRSKCGQGELPFLFVQLPLFGEPEENNESSSWALIREAQRSALSLPATGMAAALDLGEWNDLHPVNKKGVGRRLAMAAERVVYRNENSAPGPLFSAARRNNGRLFLSFCNCGKGLVAREKPHISVIAGGNLFRLPVKIESPESVSADISAIGEPEKVLYAWADNPRDRQLYNADGLPAIPFRAFLAGDGG